MTAPAIEPFGACDGLIVAVERGLSWAHSWVPVTNAHFVADGFTVR
jgi:hypothetical protein